ncbi:MAG: tetratricopeptide repeat protein [candidate division KSB1 bacterium]|nr:tetratricopeptide repeat protein [candidate division KSB1 bacterium]
MRDVRSWIVLGFAALVAGAGLVPAATAQPGRKQIKRGNELFRRELYDEALVQYQDALLQSPNNPFAQFNIGDAQYQKNNFEEALQAFERATALQDPILLSQAYYNLGNTLYRLGHLTEAILAYKKALELNPGDEDAKYNLEYVLAKLKQESQKQSLSPQPQPQQQKQEQQGGQGQEGQQKGEQRHEEQQQTQEGQAQAQQDQQQADQGRKQRAQERQLSKEEAERLLDALNEAEKKLLKDRAVHEGSIRRAKDW